MKFGDTPLQLAEGAILAHSQRIGGRTFKKGVVLSSDDINFFRKNGVENIVTARLGPNDLDENEAAHRLAKALETTGLKAGRAGTGRCNLIAQFDGLIQIDAKIIARLNRKNEAITIATVSPESVLKGGDIAATVKIITFGVAANHVAGCAKLIAEKRPVSLHPFSRLRIGLIQTTLSGTKQSVIEKAHHVTDDRITALGSEFAEEIICAHGEEQVTGAIRKMKQKRIGILLILGASAIADRRDVVPQAVINAGGDIDHFGMPVDPGNLMLLAHLEEMKILGIPGSARSPRLHGFDWLLQRFAAGRQVTARDITAMGVGGLLKEIPSRPMPRRSGEISYPPNEKNIAAVILAAGQSRRMGKRNKMLVEIDGKPMVRHIAEAIIETGAKPLVVVTGHQPEELKTALTGIDATFVHNPQFADGLSTSLKSGLGALPDNINGALIALGDMPGIAASHLNRLIAAFDPEKDQLICVPTRHGKRGNPVLWHSRFFSVMAQLSGDVGARHLIGEHADYVVDIEMDDDAVITDLDTPAALDAYLHSRKD